MKRFDIAPRTDWQKKVEETGFIWHTADGKPYWNETGYYSFTQAQVTVLEEATEEAHQMYLGAAEHIISHRLFDRFGIPEAYVPRLVSDWMNEPPALNYGRFDFGYDGVNPPKLFEYNADTPTSLIEASVIQWYWKEDLFPKRDQFNSIHEKMVARWKAIKPHLPPTVHFTNTDEGSGEDAITTAYMMDMAKEAGITPIHIPIEDIGWEHFLEEFVDQSEQEIQALYKLYPWEWIIHDEFGSNVLKSNALFIEPSWKMIFSNKAILPIIWEMNRSNPILLGTDYTKPNFLTKDTESYVVKPTLAREGSNVRIIEAGETIASSGGAYEKEQVIYQERYALPNFGGRYPVIGSWCIDGVAAGIGIREDGLITGNTASFIPHIIEG